MRNIRLRTKFLFALLVISAGLTTGTLLVVRYSVEKRVRESIRGDLRNSVDTYQTFERQLEDSLSRSAELLANLPTVRALMSTHDAATIQDASADIWRLSGSNLLVLAGRTGKILALRTSTAGLSSGMAEELLQGSLGRAQSRDWWFGGGHLYEVWIQPIYFGAASENKMTGLLAVGHEIDVQAAKDFGSIASSEVAFECGNTVVASTLDETQKTELLRQIGSNPAPGADAKEIQIGSEDYLVKTVSLSSAGGSPVSLSVLKSFDQATSFLNGLDHLLMALGLLCLLAGGVVAFLISDTFTRPLATLVAGVRALEGGDFSYPLEKTGGDEVAEVTGAFDRMRVTLQKTQEEQRLLEERLRRAHKMEAVGRLAGGVAHDFNNLLTIIRGHGDLLLDRNDVDGPLRHSVDQIHKAAGRAISMTRQLLAFSRMQVLQPRVLDLNAVVMEMGKMLPLLIGEHIEYTFVPGPKMALLRADPGQIEQVVMNLAVNARDAMPNGGALTVRTQNVVMSDDDVSKRPPMPPGSYVLLTVRDSGDGMSKETLARVFEPFFTTKEVGKGTGLGLATVYGVIKQSGGFIWVESVPGSGTAFEIYLPQVSDAAITAEPEAKPSAGAGGSETILVVEDEDGVRALACMFLRAGGYMVLEAKDGVEALAVAARHTGTIHLILSDVVMPRMGGAVLLERLKSVRPGAKGILMSGYSEYSAGPPSAGMEALMIEKPFSKNSLLGKVREVLVGDAARSKGAVSERCTI
jgi:signal transduction histidine kinase